MMKNRECKTVSEVLERIAETMCDNYCIYSRKYNTEFRSMSSEEADERWNEMIEKHCNDCPLNYL